MGSTHSKAASGKCTYTVAVDTRMLPVYTKIVYTRTLTIVLHWKKKKELMF